MSGGGPAVSLRPTEAGDRDFLFRVFAGTREEELAGVPFGAEERDAFLAQQFEAQSLHFEGLRDTSDDVVLAGGEPVGRLTVCRWPEELRVVEIALLPVHRRRGVGTVLIRGVLEEAARRRVKASAHVSRTGTVIAFYERLGFTPVAERGLHILVERRPAAVARELR